MQPKALFWAGFQAALPLMIGALAISAELNPAQALGMSILVIAGSSQFVGTQLIRDDAPFVIIVLTTFIINLRHFLYSATLTSYVKPLSTPWKLLLGYLMIDEVYAPAWTRLQQGDLTPHQWRWYFLGAGVNLMIVWWGTTWLGTVVGQVLPQSTADLLGFTLPLTFTAIVVGMATQRPMLLAAISASLVAILFQPLPYNLWLILAALVGIGTGIWAEEQWNTG
jgi:predicted branched-subunit amino acid permease